MTQSRPPSSSAHSEAKENGTASKTQKPQLSLTQTLVSGSLAGAAEVLVDHPLWTIKTRLQDGAPFTLNPRILYTGVFANAASMAPITAIMLGLNQVIQKASSRGEAKLSDQQRLFSAFVAGVGSSVVSCPTELVMTYQGKKVLSFYSAAKSLINIGGWTSLFRGLPVTAMKEGGFSAALLAGRPLLKEKIKPHCANDSQAIILSNLAAGVLGAIATQPMDTLKTIQQAAPVDQPVSLAKAIKQVLYSKKGVYGFFKGGIPRGLRVVSGITIMGSVTDMVEAEFHKRNAANDKCMK